MREIIQLIVSFTGSLGFAALFNIHGYGFSGFCYDSVDSGGGIVSYYELDDDEELGEFSEGRDLYDPFCGEHGCRYDVDDHCFSDGLAVDVQAETDVSV